MVAIFLALGIMLVAGIVAIPVLGQSVQADKGGIPNEHASSKAQGRGGSGGDCQTC